MGIFSPRDLLFTMNRIIQFKYEEPWWINRKKLDKTRNANYEHDFPVCEACNDTVEYTDDNNMCEECANEAGIAYEESRNDLDWYSNALNVMLAVILNMKKE